MVKVYKDKYKVKVFKDKYKYKYKHKHKHKHKPFTEAFRLVFSFSQHLTNNIWTFS